MSILPYPPAISDHSIRCLVKALLFSAAGLQAEVRLHLIEPGHSSLECEVLLQATQPGCMNCNTHLCQPVICLSYPITAGAVRAAVSASVLCCGSASRDQTASHTAGTQLAGMQTARPGHPAVAACIASEPALPPVVLQPQQMLHESLFSAAGLQIQVRLHLVQPRNGSLECKLLLQAAQPGCSSCSSRRRGGHRRNTSLRHQVSPEPATCTTDDRQRLIP